MQRLFAYIRRYWLRYIFGILCTIATAVLLTIIPRLSGKATDAINHSDYARLDHLIWLMVLAAIGMGVARWFSRFVIFNCGRDIDYNRLRANPAALRCIDCQRQYEKTHAVPAGPRL